MDLIKYENYQLTIADEALLVKPFRVLFNRDKSSKKERFMSEMSYVFFMCDPRSNYNYITDLGERAATIIEQEGLSKTFKPSKELEEAMEWYRKLTKTTSAGLLEDTRVAVDKIRDFLRNIDFSLTDKNKKPIYTINSVTTAVRQIPQLSKDIMEAEHAIAKELDEITRAKGGNESKNVYEDGFED